MDKPTIIETCPITVQRHKLSDGTATLSGLVMTERATRQLTGDGTLQHPLHVKSDPAEVDCLRSAIAVLDRLANGEDFNQVCEATGISAKLTQRLAGLPDVPPAPVTTYRVTRDQAVWERETWIVNVPPGIEDPDEWIREQLDEHNGESAEFDKQGTEILDHAVDGIGTDTNIERT